MHLKNVLIIISITVLSLAGSLAVAADSGKPNIIVIYTDDQGVGDASCLNADAKFQTPNLDRLGKEGISFTNGHSSDTVCTPSRYGLLTGRYCWRTVKKTGSAWPLSVGKTWSYAIEGQNSKGNSWTNTRSCEVLSTAQITTQSGTHDTYKVRCDDNNNERVFYISPALKDFAQLIHYKKRWNETINYEVLESS